MKYRVFLSSSGTQGQPRQTREVMSEGGDAGLPAVRALAQSGPAQPASAIEEREARYELGLFEMLCGRLDADGRWRRGATRKAIRGM